MTAMAYVAPDQFHLYSKHLEECSDILSTIVRTPSLPDFNGPKVEWIGERMIVT